MLQVRRLLIILCVVLTQIIFVSAFNLSPVPNIILKDPQLATQVQKLRKSYFGYSLVLRDKSLLVGAPRSQCTLLPRNKNENNAAETGQIYKCALDNPFSSTCSPFYFTDGVNKTARNYLNYAIKNYQLLGFAMDGGPKDSDHFIACAPKFSGGFDAIGQSEEYMHGVCYWSQHTLTHEPVHADRWIINPLINSELQTTRVPRRRGFYYQLGEAGFSVHATANGQQFLIGSPGINEWQGSVILFDTISNSIPSIPKAIANQQYDVYAGYAVSSGFLDNMNLKKILYLTTLPHFDKVQQNGRAYIFDYDNNNMARIYGRKLRGSQYGEFFGYAAVVVDITGDGLDDILISAPLYSMNDKVDMGAVYMFVNKGEFNFDCEILLSPFEAKGRFGTTISNLGDINMDGYKDIAIGAPFAYGNGAVAIYLGSPDGLSQIPNQKLHFYEYKNSTNTTSANNNDKESVYGSMFGHGLSKGVDIDRNGFRDLAVGAPNAETILIYKAYPVVKVEASINGLKEFIRMDEKEVKIEICWHIETNSTKTKDVKLLLNATLDARIKRVIFEALKTNQLSIEVTANAVRQCQIYNLYHTYKLMAPIEMKISYQLINDARKNYAQRFCEDCAIVDPTFPKHFQGKIKYINGCRNDLCNVDLKIETLEIPTNFTLGTSNLIPVKYKIENVGEEAYEVQVVLTNSLKLRLTKLPAYCKENKDHSEYLCTLAEGQLFASSVTIEMYLDLSDLTANFKDLVVIARVNGSGNEVEPLNNIAENVIALQSHADIDIFGETSRVNETSFVTLKKDGNRTFVLYDIQIHNNGPSTVSPLDVHVTLPVGYIKKTKSIEIVNMTSAMLFTSLDKYSYRRKTFSKINESAELTYDPLRMYEYLKNLDLPRERSSLLNCSEMHETECAESVIEIPHLKAGQKLKMRIFYSVNEEAIQKLQEYLVMIVYVTINPNARHGGNYNIQTYLKPTIIVNISTQKSLMVYIAAGIGGILILLLLIIALVKMGFFKRMTKEEMEKKLMENEEIAEMRAIMETCTNEM